MSLGSEALVTAWNGAGIRLLSSVDSEVGLEVALFREGSVTPFVRTLKRLFAGLF